MMMTDPATRRPLVSVIIPVHNGEAFLADTLESALAQRYGSLEVIAVDDGSTDGSAAVLAAFRDIRTISLANGGVAAARNAGIAAATGDFLAFLDQDDLWLSGKIEAQMALLLQDPTLDYVLTLQRRFLHPGVAAPAWARPETLEAPARGFDPSALLARRSAFDRVGTFDTRFVQASDSDWFFRATDAGLRMAFVPEPLTLRRIHAENNSRFVSDSRREFRRVAMESIRRKRERPTSAAVAGRILVIDARVVTPNRDGGSLRMFSLLQIFLARGFAVSFVPSFPESFPPFSDSLPADTARLLEIGVSLPGGGVTTADAYLEREGRQYDIVLMTGAFVASRHIAAVRRFAPQARLIFDTIDLHHLREYREARLTGNVPRLQAALKLKRVELSIARAADVTLVVSDREQSVLENEDPRIRTWVVPNIHEADTATAVPAGRRDLMFLGAFTFSPNADAMTNFVGQILPELRRRLPGVRLHIVGSDPTPEVLALACEDVVVSGWVEDLAGYFSCCRAFVAPLRFGAGIKGKLLLSMAHGLPAVVSPIAVEGIPAVAGRDVLVARTPAEWADEICRLYQDDALWATLSGHGRALIGTHYSFAAVGRRVDGLVELIGRGPRSRTEESA